MTVNIFDITISNDHRGLYNLLVQQPHLTQSRDQAGRTPLHHAVERGLRGPSDICPLGDPVRQ